MSEKVTKDYGGAASEPCFLRYDLIPLVALRRLSGVYLEGTVKYPGRAVNAGNLVPAVKNAAWQQERWNHAVDHLLRWGAGDTDEDHLAKVMWFCSVMIAVREMEKHVDGGAE